MPGASGRIESGEPNPRVRAIEAHRHVRLAIPPEIFRVRELLRSEQGDLRVVGGFVRDAARGDPSDDLDLVFDATSEQARNAFEQVGLKATHPFPGNDLLRTSVGDLSVDALGLGALGLEGEDKVAAWMHNLHFRDLTMNTMTASLEGEVHDPLGGWDDAVAGRVRWNGDRDFQLRSDPIRVLRWIRFCLRYGQPLDLRDVGLGGEEWDILPVLHTIQEQRVGRVMTELGKLLRADRNGSGLAFLEHSGLHGALGLPPALDDRRHGTGEDPWTPVFGVGYFEIFHRMADTFDAAREAEWQEKLEQIEARTPC